MSLLALAVQSPACSGMRCAASMQIFFCVRVCVCTCAFACVSVFFLKWDVWSVLAPDVQRAHTSPLKCVRACVRPSVRSWLCDIWSVLERRMQKADCGCFHVHACMHAFFSQITSLAIESSSTGNDAFVSLTQKRLVVISCATHVLTSLQLSHR